MVESRCMCQTASPSSIVEAAPLGFQARPSPPCRPVRTHNKGPCRLPGPLPGSMAAGAFPAFWQTRGRARPGVNAGPRGSRAADRAELVAAVGAAQPASAAESSFTLPAGLGCSFALKVTLTGGTLQPRNVTTGNGDPTRIVTAGSTGTLTIENLDTPKSISFPSRGVGQTEATEGNSTTVKTGGQLLLILFPSDSPPGPSTTLYTGKVVYTINQTNDFQLQSTAGRQIDICAELAA